MFMPMVMFMFSILVVLIIDIVAARDAPDPRRRGPRGNSGARPERMLILRGVRFLEVGRRPQISRPGNGTLGSADSYYVDSLFVCVCVCVCVCV